MTDKKRIEEIKTWIKKMGIRGNTQAVMPEHDMQFLIDVIERQEKALAKIQSVMDNYDFWSFEKFAKCQDILKQALQRESI